MTTDTSEYGLESLICTALAGEACAPPAAGEVREPKAGYGGVGWSCGSYRDYDREYCVDLAQLAVFFRATQPEAAEDLALDGDSTARRRFLARLQGEIAKRGVIEVLRHGIRHGEHELTLFYGTPSPGNEGTRERFERNRFTVTRQLRYSRDESRRAQPSAMRAIVAFSGEHEFGGAKVSEASLNGFASRLIAEKFQEDPYRFLVCADKFQTGYDEPLLHTMYVDKTLSGVKAVQTLSRLNRAHPKKHDVFVLDFLNDADTIRDAFADFYRTTILADETDPDRLHDLQADLDGAQVYSPAQVEDFVRLYIDGAERDRLDPILDACAAVYQNELDEDGQVDFKGKAKGFVRTYNFLSCLLPWTNAAWEQRSIFLNFLIPKLPAPQEEDLSKGILDAIDMDSYRVEKQAVQAILLPDEDAEVDAAPASGGGHRPDPELDRLSNIITQFNDLFGDIAWEDSDRIQRLVTEEIPSRVARDAAFRNAMGTRTVKTRALSTTRLLSAS